MTFTVVYGGADFMKKRHSGALRPDRTRNDGHPPFPAKESSK
jgi:hypothetical protein